MPELVIPNLEYRYYDEHGFPAATSDPAFVGVESSDELQLIKQQKIIDRLSLPKPDWFNGAERDAVAFLGSLAFTTSSNVYLMGEGRGVNNLFGTPTTVAFADQLTNDIFIRANKLDQLSEPGQQRVTTAKLLVHENAHATAVTTARVAVYKTTDDDVAFSYRSGFCGETKSKAFGHIFEEGFCELLAGWFERVRQDPLTPAVGIKAWPSPDIPVYLRPPMPLMVAGPAGYIMELLAWGAQQRRIMSASAFVANLLESRRPQTQLTALRIHAQAVDMLEPGLYPYLRDLGHNRSNLHKALAEVHGIVTRPGRGRLSRVV